eukprot:523260-Hanusia_phi.AAC.1
MFSIQILVAAWDVIAGFPATLKFVVERARACPLRAVARDILLVVAVLHIEGILQIERVLGLEGSMKMEDQLGFAKFSKLLNIIQFWNLGLELSCMLSAGSLFGELRASQGYNVLMITILVRALYSTRTSRIVQITGIAFLAAAALPAFEIFLTENVKGRPHLSSFVLAICTSIIGSLLGPFADYGEIIYRIGFLFNGLETSLSFLAASDVCPVGATLVFYSQQKYRMMVLSVLVALCGVIPNIVDSAVDAYQIEDKKISYSPSYCFLFLALNVFSCLTLALWWRECRLSFPNGHIMLLEQKQTFLERNRKWLDKSYLLNVSFKFSARSHEEHTKGPAVCEENDTNIAQSGEICQIEDLCETDLKLSTDLKVCGESQQEYV